MVLVDSDLIYQDPMGVEISDFSLHSGFGGFSRQRIEALFYDLTISYYP
jgi:hypothetical protein